MWQKCPLCLGYVVLDCTEICPVCKGNYIIDKKTGKPPVEQDISKISPITVSKSSR